MSDGTVIQFNPQALKNFYFFNLYLDPLHQAHIKTNLVEYIW